LATFSYEDGVPEVYSDLVEQEQITVYRVAIPEGLTSWQIVQGLNVADFLSGEVVDIPAEGTLAPDTYEVRRGDDRNAILERMRAAQEVILAEVWAGRADGLPIETPEEALILASIIEKETSVPDERRQVASVFVNRLNQGMRLQTDPTVIYGSPTGGVFWAVASGNRSCGTTIPGTPMSSTGCRRRRSRTRGARRSRRRWTPIRRLTSSSWRMGPGGMPFP
jgi:UPF0755 protein